MKNSVKICVIDTNIDINHNCFDSTKDSIIINKNFNKQNVDYSCGHGTAVCNILLNKAPFSQITLFPIFAGNAHAVDVDLLIKVLYYIYENESCDIINLSCGLLYTHKENNLREICNLLTERGVIIVSAYDNSGIMTVPACFNNVIGVDVSDDITKKDEYYFVKNSPVNIRGYAGVMKVCWENNSHLLLSGSSFVVPYITSIIADCISKGKEGSKICEYLELHAEKSIDFMKNENSRNTYSIRNAALFPFNKEMHALIRYSDLMNFNLVECYDIRYSVNMGKTVNKIIGINSEKDYKVEDIEKLDFGQIDVLIIGHLDRVIKILGTDFVDRLLDKLNDNKVDIYCYDSYIFDHYYVNQNRYANNCYYPKIDNNDIPIENFKKMFPINVPVVNIMGTQSKQGKYTVQLALYRKFLNEKYNAKILSTEPNGLLMGASEVFPFGYQGTVEISCADSIIVLNSMLKKIEKEHDPDIVLCASQSSSLPYNNIAYRSISIDQNAFLFGTNPDAIILCVSLSDDFEYIGRTMNFIEASANSKVLALVVYPVVHELNSGTFVKTENLSSTKRMCEFKENLSKQFDIPSFELDEVCINNLFDLIVGFFQPNA